MNTRIANNAILFALAIAGASFAASPTSNEVQKPMSQRDLSFTNPGTDEGFLKSWHSREQYLTKSEYLFDGKLTAKVNEKQENWFLRTFAQWTTKAVEAVQRGRFTGKAIAQTLVYHEEPNLCLLRDYKYVEGKGVWAGEIAPANKTIRDAFAAASQLGKSVGVDNINEGVWLAVGAFDPVYAEWGKALSDISMEWVKANVGELNDDGAIAFGPKSLVGKAMDSKEASKVLNIAEQFSKDICNKKVSIAYSNGRMKAAEVQNVSLDGIDPGRTPADFRKLVSRCRPLAKDEPLDALLSRESAMPTKDLFDNAVRKRGDKWIVDASLFSTFLHPDLKGCFTGSAILEYVEDQKGEDGYYSDEDERITKREHVYNVRKLEVIPSAKINGKMEATDFKYDEISKGGNFRASYDPKTKVEIFVDMKSGHIVYADILLKARDVDALPSIPLMRGFKGNGDASLEIKFYGEVLPMASK